MILIIRFHFIHQSCPSKEKVPLWIQCYDAFHWQTTTSFDTYMYAWLNNMHNHTLSLTIYFNNWITLLCCLFHDKGDSQSKPWHPSSSNHYSSVKKMSLCKLMLYMYIQVMQDSLNWRWTALTHTWMSDLSYNVYSSHLLSFLNLPCKRDIMVYLFTSTSAKNLVKFLIEPVLLGGYYWWL